MKKPTKKTRSPKKNKPLQSAKIGKLAIPILSLIMVINALSYGTIIPLLYPYASKFGIDGLGLGLLFSAFSLFQFLATPVIGRLSDQYGRKPLLLFSLFGTGISQILFASAQNIPQLFFARILDGITGGNNSVAQAIIADSLEGKERTKAFGLLGASFGFGFLIGPAIGGVLSTISMTAPFWFSAFLAIGGSILGWIFLPETLPAAARAAKRLEQSRAKTKQQDLLNLPLLWKALTDSVAGPILLVTFLGMTSHQALVLGFQSFVTDILKLNTTYNGLMFASIGLVSILMQAIGLRWLLKKIPSQTKLLKLSLVASGVMCVVLFFSASVWYFVAMTLIYVAVFSPQNIVLTGLLSQQTKAEDQGGMMGIQQAYLSLGQIIGPVIAGVLTGWSVNAVFLLAAALFAISLVASSKVVDPRRASVDI